MERTVDGLVNSDSNADADADAAPAVPDEAALRRMAAAAARHRAAEPDRRAIRQREAEGHRYPDDDEHLLRRAARLVEQHEVPGPRLLAAGPEEVPPRQAERIIGASNDLQSLNFLARGLRAAAGVARIWFAVHGGPMRPQATGFLVAPNLLLTNHHVFPDAVGAREAFAEFGAEVGIDNELPTRTARFTPDPDTLFLTDVDLDFTLVALSPGADGRLPGEVFGHIPLIAAEGKLVVGDPVNVVGHPDGRLKEIAIRENRFTQRFDHFLQYETDTEPGNSGSPVFNDQWEAVALHHSGVPALDDEGHVLDLTGAPWTPDQGQGAIRWIANEGIRISVVLRRLAAFELDDTRRALLAQLGPMSGLGSGPVVTPVAPAPAMPGQRAVPGGVETVPAPAGLRGRAGAFGGRAQLVFVHGRNQQGRDPALLRRVWTAGLNSGLTMAGLATIDPQDVWFPFYGNRLLDAMESVGAAPGGELPLSPSGRVLYERLLTEAAARTGMPPEPVRVTEGAFLADLVGTMREPLGWIAAHTGVDRLVVAAAFRDVAAYLDTDVTRDAVLAQVLETMPTSGPVVLVAHSLGTVVAMDLLPRLGAEVTVTGLVTVGSPLGMDTVYSRLRVGGPHLPPIAGPWFNAWCPTDAVAIGCPLSGGWSGIGAERAVVNAHDRSHDIGEYLGHPEVALPIGRLLA